MMVKMMNSGINQRAIVFTHLSNTEMVYLSADSHPSKY